MKKIKLFNAEQNSINLVVNFNEDITVQPQSFVVIETNARFNSDNFYVEGEENWQARYNTENGDIELYIPKESWIDEAYKMYGKKMQTV